MFTKSFFVLMFVCCVFIFSGRYDPTRPSDEAAAVRGGPGAPGFRRQGGGIGSQLTKVTKNTKKGKESKENKRFSHHFELILVKTIQKEFQNKKPKI